MNHLGMDMAGLVAQSLSLSGAIIKSEESMAALSSSTLVQKSFASLIILRRVSSKSRREDMKWGSSQNGSRRQIGTIEDIVKSLLEDVN